MHRTFRFRRGGDPSSFSAPMQLQDDKSYAFFSDGIDTLVVDPDLSPENVEAGSADAPDPASFAKRRRQLEALFGLAGVERRALNVERRASSSAYPNPFDDAVTFEFDLGEDAEVVLTVHDVLGRRVTTLTDGAIRSAGQHLVRWNGRDANGTRLAAGTYFYGISADGLERTSTVVRAGNKQLSIIN